MKKLDKFILKAFVGPFIAILSVVLFILMFQFLWVYIDELVGKGLGFGVILEFLFWGTCTVLPLALPLATLLSSMMTVGSMAENNELLSIKASGISFARVLAPLMAASLVISIGAFFAGNNLVSKAFNEIFTLREDISRTKDEIKIPPGTFYDGIEGYILRIENQKENGVMEGVMVYDHTSGRGNTAISLADSATISISKNKDYLDFTLFNGANYQETNKMQSRDTSLKLQKIDFAKQELIIPLNNYTFEKSDSVKYGEQSRCMTLRQLSAEHDTLTNRIAKAHPTAIKTIYASGTLNHANQLDTTRRPATDEFFNPKEDRLLEFNSPVDASEAYSRAMDQAARYVGEIGSSCSKINESAFFLRHMDIELLKKFAQALACLVLFFIGAPLGSLIKKGGLGVSAIVSALFFVLYWVIDISGTKLATDGAIEAAYGVFISAIVLAPIGLFLTRKAIHDSELFSSMDSFKSTARKVWSKLYRLVRPVRIVYMGTPEFAVMPLDKLIKNGYKVVGVVTVADKPSGRGLKINESAVKQYATAHGIPVLQPLNLKDPEFLEALKAWKADMFVVVAFRMLPEEVWKIPRLGTFNLHAALLPQYRGAAPINWAVINGEKLTGVTTFMIDKNMDTGGIILRQECRIGPEDTAGDVHDKLMEIGSGLVLQTVEGLVQGNIELRTQRSFIQGSEVLKPAPKITRELCDINWEDSTDNIYNLIRGLSPYPAAFTTLKSGQQIKIFKTEKNTVPAEEGAMPGDIISDGKTFFAIKTSDGTLSIKELQLQGKKRMGVEEFLRGFRGF